MQPDDILVAEIPAIVSRYRSRLGLPDAEDIAQEAALIVLRQIRSGREIDRLANYMAVVAANLRRDLVRELQNRGETRMNYDPPSPPQHERLFVIRQMVAIALAGITRRRREALESFYLRGEWSPNDSLHCCLRFNALRAARSVLERAPDGHDD